HLRHPRSNNYRTRMTRIQQIIADFFFFKIFVIFYYEARPTAKAIGKYLQPNRAQAMQSCALIGSEIMPLLRSLGAYSPNDYF
ncbi:MAG: hypothetical protein ACLFUH_02160, partial [Bacteroidales bacterium]